MLTKKNREDLSHLGGVFNKTIILLALVGYEMIIANSYPMPTRGIIVKYTVKIKKITVSGPFIVKTP